MEWHVTFNFYLKFYLTFTLNFDINNTLKLMCGQI